MSEIWIELVNYPGFSVSDTGLVRRDKDEVILYQGTSSRYAYVGVTLNGKAVRRYVHVLVAEAFIGPKPPKHDVNHKDSNRLNNHAANLEYLTRSANCRHAPVFGRPFGDRVVPIEEWPEVVRRFEAGEGVWNIADSYQINASSISKIVKKQRAKELAASGDSYTDWL